MRKEGGGSRLIKFTEARGLVRTRRPFSSVVMYFQSCSYVKVCLSGFPWTPVCVGVLCGYTIHRTVFTSYVHMHVLLVCLRILKSA